MLLHLVLIETSGNQNYIFATNKLRENVGASELTYRVGTQWVLEAVRAETQKALWSDDAAALRANLCRPDRNPPIEDEQASVEIITATSGKALLLVNDREIGRRIVRAVTSKALQEAPGLDVCGVISKEFDWGKESLDNANREVHERFEEVRANRPGPMLRFLRLPVIAECQTSGLPAAKLHTGDEGKIARAELSLKKRAVADAYRQRMQSLLDRKGLNKKFPRNPGDLEKRCDWLAVVHADGNGLGEIFLNFAHHIDFEKERETIAKAIFNRRYVQRLREFSLALDICTENAFLAALAEITERRFSEDEGRILPLLPIILGGDDLTVMCDGKDALRFTHKFLTAFETETARVDQEMFGDIVKKVAGEAFTPQRLSACAGVAIVKPHFPFSAAYDLAAELITSAKCVKKLVTDSNKQDAKHPNVRTPWPCSAMDFHALYDSSSSELDAIREKLRERKPTGELRNYARPYVVTPTTELSGAEGADWARLHHWDVLTKQVQAILAPEKDSNGQETSRRALPNTQLHELRAGLPLGKEIADGRFKLIKQRYELQVFTGDNAETLYSVDKADAKDEVGERRDEFTTLLDALDAANFWRKEDAK